MRISDWSSDVCSSDLQPEGPTSATNSPSSSENVTSRMAVNDVSPPLTGKHFATPSTSIIVKACGRRADAVAALRCRAASFTARMDGFDEAVVDEVGGGEAAGGGDIEVFDVRDHRSDERRVGKECVRTCRSLGSQEN